MVLDLLLGCLCGLDMNTKDVFKNALWLRSGTKTVTVANFLPQEQNLPLGTCLSSSLLFCGYEGSIVLEDFLDKDLVRSQRNRHRFSLSCELARPGQTFHSFIIPGCGV